MTAAPDREAVSRRLHGDTAPGRHVSGWARARGRHLGSVAFLANRVTGLLLIGYLYLHLGVLFLLTRGAGSWATVLSLFKNPYFLAAEAVLIGLVLVHGLNGLRLALIGSGIGVRHHKAMFATTMAVSAAGFTAAVLAMYQVI